VNEIKEHIRSALKLSEEETSIFLSEFSKVELNKNDVFAEKGKICHEIGLIEKGLMKCVYYKNGNEVVFEFAYENSFIADYYSFVTNIPSEKEIRCLEDTTVYVINRQRLEKLARAYSYIQGINRKMNENLFLKTHNRLTSFLLQTPLERYQRLITERQDLAQRIPQYLIASYLNVKPETISRIRKRIASQGIY
jgi:CRP-like cAMP-binding protein